jgi:hypothetical protein
LLIRKVQYCWRWFDQFLGIWRSSIPAHDPFRKITFLMKRMQRIFNGMPAPDRNSGVRVRRTMMLAE